MLHMYTWILWISNLEIVIFHDETKHDGKEDWGKIPANSDRNFVISSPIIFCPLYYYYDKSFNVREYFNNYENLLFAVEYNSKHFLLEHSYKPRQLLEQEAIMEDRRPKSVFLKDLTRDDILYYVKEALLYTNICVQIVRAGVAKIRCE